MTVTLLGQPWQRGRYTVALSAVHDWGRAGGRAPPVTLAHLDGTAVVVVRPGLEAHLLAGWGGRGCAEAVVGWDAVRYGGLQKHLQLSLAAEAFTWGRFDVDGRVEVQLFGRSLEVAVKGLAAGMGQPGARYLGAAEVRWRFLGGRLYALGTGAFVSMGLGVDNAR
jgi:hypothetical protein